jgi:hypothetical protein
MHRLTSICVRHPWVTVSLVLALTALAGVSALRAAMAVGTDATLGANHPAVRQFDEFLGRFGGGYPIVIAYECANPKLCDSALDPAALKMAYSVSRRLEQAKHVSRVSSPATSSLLVRSADFLDARRLVEDGRVVEDPWLLQLALHDPLWSRALVSLDGRVGAIVVELASTETPALFGVVELIRTTLDPFERNGFRFYPLGDAILWVTAHEDAVSSAVRVGIGTGGMLFLTLLLLLRSLPAVVISLTAIGVASAWTIGMLPLLGWQRSELTSGAATLILVIGCADCVHFVARYLETRSTFEDERRALVSTSRWVLAPCFLTTATTAASFASFASGGVHSLTQFGLLAGIGVSLAFLLTFTLLPAMLALIPPKPRRRQYSAAWQEVLSRLANLGARRNGLVLFVAGALAIIGVSGIPKLRVELGLYDLWGPDHPISRALSIVSDNLQRPDRLELDLELPSNARLEDPAVIGELWDIQRRLLDLDGLEEARSIVTLLLHAQERLRPEDSGASIPSSEEAVGELLTLIASGDSTALDSWVTLDHRRVRISLEAKKLSLPEKRKLLADSEALLEGIIPAGWRYLLTGTVMLAFRHGSEFGRSQTTIVSASSILVFLLVGLYLRSLPWAVLAMIPNAVALLLLFGAMGHWGIQMNFGSAIVAPIAIGIAADDTIHFLTAYSRERRSGAPAVLALRSAILSVGEAVIATAIALSLGFLSMMASPFPSISNIGLLGAIAIIGATLADLLVLPALIATVAEWRGFQGLPGRHE